MILDGKFGIDSGPITYVGVVVLIGASVWNVWPVGVRIAIGSYANSQEGDMNIMAAKRRIEVFSAGCPACKETIALVNRVACPSCEVSVLDMRQTAVAERAKALGLRSVPAVVIDGRLADCCSGGGPHEATLRAAGLGQPR